MGAELEIHFVGNSEIQWSIVSGGDKQTSALFGKSGMGLAPGGSLFYISNRNLYFGLSGLYRQFRGEFQTPNRGPNKTIAFREEALIFRIGYIDYFSGGKWSLNHWDEILPAYPFGHIRMGVFRSDISSSSSDFEAFDPAYAGLFGIEFGALYRPKERFYFFVSGMVDYTFTVVPYTAHYSDRREEILNNIMMFNLCGQFGLISEEP